MRIALGIPLSFKVLCNRCNAFSKNLPEGFFTHITTDSREASFGDLFFSLSSDMQSAENHIKEAHMCGAKTVSSFSKDADFIVSDCEETLLKLAAFYKSQLKSLISTIAITGRVGKTTTKDFAAAFLGASYKTHKTYMNYNNSLGVSLSLLSAPKDTEILVLELGMNAEGEIKKLSEAVEPDYAVITNVASAHIGKLGSLELIARAKLEISEGMSKDNILAPYDEALLQSAKYKFSLFESASDFYLAKTGINNRYSFFHDNEKIIEFSTSYKASHHLKALLIALSLGCFLQMSKEKMPLGIENTEKITLRQKLIAFRHFSVFDDTYSSSPEAVKADIEYLKLQYPDRPFSLALGDMLELGQKTVELHNEIGKLAYTSGARKLYAFGSYAYFIRDGARSAGMSEKDISANPETDFYQALAREIYKNSLLSEIVLIKASHALHSEKILEEIERLDKEC